MCLSITSLVDKARNTIVLYNRQTLLNISWEQSRNHPWHLKNLLPRHQILLHKTGLEPFCISLIALYSTCVVCCASYSYIYVSNTCAMRLLVVFLLADALLGSTTIAKEELVVRLGDLQNTALAWGDGVVSPQQEFARHDDWAYGNGASSGYEDTGKGYYNSKGSKSSKGGYYTKSKSTKKSKKGSKSKGKGYNDGKGYTYAPRPTPHYTHAPTKTPPTLTCGDGQIDYPEECDPYLVERNTGTVYPDGGCHYAFPDANNKLQCIGCHCVGCGNVSTASSCCL